VLEIGSSLREARQRRGIELAEAADATMIRSRYLEALEDERFEVLPEGPYLRSFLREYAEFLGLDGDVLVSEWMLQFGAIRPDPGWPEPPRVGRFDLLLSDPARRRGALVFLALVAAGVGVWRLGGSSPTTVRSAAPPERASPSSIPAAPKPEIHRTTTPERRPPLVLAAVRGPCWVLVRTGSATGAVIEERTLLQGQTVRYELRKPLWMRLGAPWNVDLSIGGRTVGTSPSSSSPLNILVSAAGVRRA
jgi:cytoskeleton protein RodZ